MKILSKIKHGLLTGVVLSSILASPIGLYQGHVSANFENGNQFCLTGSDNSSSDSSSSSSGSGGSNANGSVNTPKGAISSSTVDDIKKIAQHMNDTYGFGQNQLAVIMAVGLRESTWQLDARNTSGQVAGLFQWGYGSTNGDRITPSGADPSHLGVDGTIKILDYEIKGGKNAQSTSMVALMKDAGNDKTKAFVAWAKYEGVSVSDGQSRTDEVIQWADAVAGILGTDNMAINQSKIDSLPSGSGGTANTDTDSNGTQTGVSDETICGNAGNSDTEDGTGSISTNGVNVWKRDDVPSDVKAFIHDPEKAGLQWHGGSGWLGGITPLNDNCTDFAESYFNLIWGLKMSGGVHGNGEAVASAMASQFGGNTSSSPKSGAIGSVPGGKGGTAVGIGHVLVVEHVLANGDIIVAEQNYASMSGALNNERQSWNYRVISKDSYTNDKYEFYTPASGSLNWGN